MTESLPAILDGLPRHRAAIETTLAHLSDSDHVIAVLLVGSMASGTADAVSDVDLIALSDDGSFDQVWNRRTQLSERAIYRWDVSPRGAAGAHKWLTSDLVLVECLVGEIDAIRVADPWIQLLGADISERITRREPILRAEVRGGGLVTDDIERLYDALKLWVRGEPQEARRLLHPMEQREARPRLVPAGTSGAAPTTPQLLIISGPAGVGKSAVAHELSLQLERRGVAHAVIDTDELDRIYPVPDELPNVTQRNLASVWQTFSERVDRLILVGVWLHRQSELEWIVRAIPNASVTRIQLHASEDVLASRIAGREIGSGRDAQLTRTRQQARDVLREPATDVQVVDTDDEPVVDTARRIARMVGW